MTRKTSRLLPVLACSICLCLPAWSRDEYTRHFDQTVRVSDGEALHLEHTFGAVTIRTHSSSDVIIHADIRVSASDAAQARQYADKVEIEVQPGSLLSIRTKYPKEGNSFFNRPNVSFAAQYEITVPENTPLTVRNSFSEVSVSGVKANCDIVTSHAQLSFQNSTGSQRLENSFAQIQVSHNTGNVAVQNSNGAVGASDINGGLSVRDRFASLTLARISSGVTVVNSNGAVELNDSGGAGDIRNAFGSVTVQKFRGDLGITDANGKIDVSGVSGSANLRTTFGGINIANVSGNVVARSSNSRVEANRIGGSLTVVNSFGAVHITSAGRDVRVDSGNGAVTLEHVKGLAHIKTSFGMVQVTDVNGPLDVENSNGSVEASTVKSATVSTSFGAVALNAVSGPVQVTNRNGSVDVASFSTGNCAPITIHTSFAAVRVHLAPDASYRVEAKTSFGRVRSDFPMTVSGSLSTGNVSGVIGGGACPMKLSNSNGSIEILRGGS